MRKIAIGLCAAGLLAVFAMTGCAAAAGGSAAGRAAPGSVHDCTAFASHAIRAHSVIAVLPAACQGLSRAQVNYAASDAIRVVAGSGPKSAWRRRAGKAAPSVSALLSGPVPAQAGGAAGAGGAPSGSGGSLLGGVSELAVRVAALLAWLATAASGGYVLVRWLRAGGRLRRRPVIATATAPSTVAPSAVIAGHAVFGLLGLLLWAVFTLTGWVVVAWITVGLLGPVAGLGMGVLLLGLPSPRPPGLVPLSPAAARSAGGTATLVAPAAPAFMLAGAPRARVPVFVIAAHGLFATVLLLLVITATIGAV